MFFFKEIPVPFTGEKIKGIVFQHAFQTVTELPLENNLKP
jgi:hypothetical protein